MVPTMRAAAEISLYEAVEQGAITFTNHAATNWINGELVIEYTDPTAVGTLKIGKGSVIARVLAVGGGGGGGSVNSNNNGGGGGGGGGGFVTAEGLRFKGDYLIYVGAGGLAADERSMAPGGDGGATAITNDNAQVSGIDIAWGGGGGGAKSAGRDGGSGGGGSATTSGGATGNGGKGRIGQGNDGGAGNNRYSAAGGGGAGASADGTKDITSTKGGDGRSSDIRGKENDYFGGGGGGGHAQATADTVTISGGKGGGGMGGKKTAAELRDGENGRGGGGGGNGGNTGGTNGNWIRPGKGGSGIFIIRLSNYRPGGVTLPDTSDKPYNGEDQTIAESTVDYTVSGEVTEKNAGTYTVTFTLTEKGKEVGWDSDYQLDPGDSTNVVWHINKKKIPTPQKTQETFTYNYEYQTGFEASAWYSCDAKNYQKNAGTYYPTISLTDSSNTEWEDGKPPSRDDLSWTIYKLPIEKPKAVAAADRTYNRNVQTGFVENAALYIFSDENRQANAGTYQPTATLADANTVWDDLRNSNPRSDFEWKIVPKKVARPTAVSGLIFDATEQTGSNPATAPDGAYSLTDSRKTDAGDYTFVAVLDNPEGFTNFTWMNGDTGDYSVDWSIAQRTVVWPPAGAEKSYTYTKGETYTPIPENEWYDRAGTGGASVAGEYACEVTLKHNDGGVENIVWYTGGHETKTWNWKIAKREVAFPTFGNFTYEENPKGSAVPRTVLTIPPAADYSQTSGDALNQTQAGEYSFTLSLNDPANYSWKDLGTSDAQSRDWTIAKGTNVISELKMDDWQVGQSATVPTCRTKFGDEADEVRYTWSTNRSEKVWNDWKSVKPSEPGTYYLKAETRDNQANWVAAVPEYRRFCIWVHPLESCTDYVDFDLTRTLADKVVVIKLASPQDADGVVTKGLPGYEYRRAAKDELCFVLKDAAAPDDRSQDRLVFYKVNDWNSVEAKIALLLSDNAGTSPTLRLYWHLADGKEMRFDNHPEDVEGNERELDAKFDRVNREGIWVDYWQAPPKLSKNRWSEGDDPAQVDNGRLFKSDVRSVFVTMPFGAETNSAMPSASGAYLAVFDLKDHADTVIYKGAKSIPFDIVNQQYYPKNLGGTADGRILLGNNDDNPDGPVAGQAYWQDETHHEGYSTWWAHTGYSQNKFYPYLNDTTEHTLYLTEQGVTKVLWRIYNAFMGSTYPSNGQPYQEFNYLPWANTSRASLEDKAVESPAEVTYFIMQNKRDAAIVSGCYENGVGTVYFDVVNEDTKDSTSEIAVEIATVTATGKVPTDENCRAEGQDDPYYYLTHDADGNEKNMWKKAESIQVLKKEHEKDEFVDDAGNQPKAKDGVVIPRIVSGGANDAFYRVIVPINRPGGVRFRIRRTTVDESTTDVAKSLVVLDNILVSPPAMGASLTTPGTPDDEGGRTGKQALGWVGALSKPLPSVTDEELFGRAQVKEYRVTSGYSDVVDCSKFIASARLYYRWRYLKQYVGDWKMVYLDTTSLTGEKGEIMRTAAPLELDFKGTAGDIEWYYDMTLQAMAYVYCDYSGCGVAKPVGTYSEAESQREDHYNRDDGALASGGDEWFARIREGRSAYERMQIVIKSPDGDPMPLAETTEMSLSADDMWRGMVMLPTKDEDGEEVRPHGKYKVHFRGRNRWGEDPDEPDREGWEMFGYVPDEVADELAIPSKSKIELAGENWATFTLDEESNYSNYLEFKMSEHFLSAQIGHVEYQDFNHWNDAKSDVDEFRADFTDTNSVAVTDMNTYPLPLDKWRLFAATNNWWNESFYLADYDPAPGSTADFPKDVFFLVANTPAGWNAHGITFVSERLVTKQEQKTSSGMSGKLLGGGDGFVELTSADLKEQTDTGLPRGLEKIELRARLGQSYTMDAISYHKPSYDKDNYTFFLPVTMSHRTSSAAQAPSDMTVGSAVSLIGYYADDGCYEFRAERKYSGKTVHLSIYKWRYHNYEMEAELLAESDVELELWSNETDADGQPKAETDRLYHGMFISLRTEYNDEEGFDPKETEIVCGVMKNGFPIGEDYQTSRPWSAFTNKVEYLGLAYTDKSKPFGSGSYGVASRDCSAKFLMPAHLERAMTWADFDQTMALLEDDDPDFRDDRPSLSERRGWSIPDGHGERLLDASLGPQWTGIAAPTNLVQTLDLYLKPAGSADNAWGQEPVARAEISGNYEFKPIGYDLKLDGQWDIRLVTGSNALDVVVDDIVQHCWNAPDGDGVTDIRDAGQSDFYYSQALIETNAVAGGAQYLTFQPTRVDGSNDRDRPLALRSPVLNGLGSFSFTYACADTNVELWVQVATNNVQARIQDYNISTRSVDSAAEQDVGVWYTVAKYSCHASDPDLLLGTNGTKTVYLGWHNHRDRQVKGLFRLYVPPTVVSAAKVALTNETCDVDYGRVRIESVTCKDEPGISPRSWRGWNMRTIGDGDDSEHRMNLSDMLIEDGQSGLVCALNNSMRNVKDNKGNSLEDDDPQLNSGLPAIYSPTMQPVDKKRGVGSVEFRARLYATNDVLNTEDPAGEARVMIWGSNDGRGTDWQCVATNVITSRVFSNFVWTANTANFKAIKLEVSDATRFGAEPTFDRVILDEIVIGEKVPPEIGFKYARPFRMDLFKQTEIADIMSPNEQPLAGESWGVQAQLSLKQLTDEIDVSKGFKVYLSYYPGLDPWGYESWKGNGKAVNDIELIQVGDASNLVFRSYGETPRALVEPAPKGGEVVQFMLEVRYTTRDGIEDKLFLSSDTWQQPDWFYPLDYNRQNGGDYDLSKFAAYTVLDTVSPGRAWINEVNWNDGKDSSGEQIKDRQFIEICVPANIDMSGWKLMLTDYNTDNYRLATFGQEGIPKQKDVTENMVNGYEFLVLKSPESQLPEADASWYRFDTQNIKNGTLRFNNPYQFSLVRPSGIIEHQFVVHGTNTLSALFRSYDGTNLVRELNEEDCTKFPYRISPKRFFAGADLTSKAKGTERASLGVVGGGNSPDPSYWPGGSNTWEEGLSFTPGRLNVGQTIPEGWFMPSNGTNSWVYFSTSDPHITQAVGSETNRSILAIVQQGKSTNVTYMVDKWFEMSVTENDRTTVSGKAGKWTYTIYPTGTVYVTGHERPRQELETDFGLGADNPYADAVRRWLLDEYGDYDVEDIRLARCKGLGSRDEVLWMSLTDMYWLGIPPVPETEAERNFDDGVNRDGTNWWFRCGIVRNADNIISRGGSLYTNRQMTVTLYASNACTAKAWAPYRLRGVGYEDSRTFDYGKNVWTSETFKVYGRLKLSSAEKFLAFRIFTFDENSFAGADGLGRIPPFSAVIDIMDPFRDVVGRNYGWDLYPNTEAFFTWRINSDAHPYSTETLKADSTYKSTPSE